ncbi:hypothetical protein MBLNU459_g3919t2 [Dothideomycetes sp. NU459]
MASDNKTKEYALGAHHVGEAAEKSDHDLVHAKAAEGAAAEHDISLLQALKKYPKACFWSIAISSSIIMEGYDIVLISSLFGQPAFAKRYGEYDSAAKNYQLSAAWQAGLSNGDAIGTIVGAFFNGYLTHKFVPLVGQVLCAIPWGVFATIAPAYASEVCPTALRGYLTVYVNVTWAFGQLVAAGVMSTFSGGTTRWAYRIPFAIQWAWPFPIAWLVFLAPESPWYLIRKGRLDAAKQSITRLSSSLDPEDNERTLAMMRHPNQIEMDMDAGTSYLDCFKGTNRRRTEIVCMKAFAAQSLCGSAMGGTPTYFFLQAGLPTSISCKMSIGGLGLAAVGTLILWKLLHSFGRRTLYLWGLGTLSAIILIVGFVSVGASHSVSGPICYAVVGETSDTRLRNKSVCLARIAYYIAQIISNVINPYMLNPSAGDWRGKTGFFWGGCALLFTAWTFFRMPEMKGRTYEELDLLFANKVKTRDFKTSSVDAYAVDETVIKRE